MITGWIRDMFKHPRITLYCFIAHFLRLILIRNIFKHPKILFHCFMKRGCILCKGSNLLWHDTCVSVRTAHIVKSLKHSLLCIRQMLAVGSALHGSILLNNQLKLRFRIARRCSVKKALVKLLQHSEENTCAMRPATLLNKRLSHSYFSLDFAKFLRTPFLMEHLW